MEKFTYNLQGQDIIEARKSEKIIFSGFDMQRFADSGTINFTVVGTKKAGSGTEKFSADKSSDITALLSGTGTATWNADSSSVSVTGATLAGLKAVLEAYGADSNGPGADMAYTVKLTSDITVDSDISLANALQVEGTVKITVEDEKSIQLGTNFVGSNILVLNENANLTIGGSGTITGGTKVTTGSQQTSDGSGTITYNTGIVGVLVSSGSTLNVSGTVTINCENGYGIIAPFGSNHSPRVTGYTINIGDGTETNSPTITGLTGILSLGTGTLNIKSGKIEVADSHKGDSAENTAVEFRNGTLNISGGEIIGGTGTTITDSYGDWPNNNTYSNAGVVVSPTKDGFN